MSERPGPAPIPYGRQWVDDEDIAAVVACLRGDFLTTGPLVAAFEAALVAATGAKRAVAVNSGTAALHAMYFAAGLRPGDEIVAPPLTFAATANAALYLGATVRFADVLPDTGLLDPAACAAAIGPKTRLVVPVDYAGHPADYDAIAPAARARGARVVADAAHSLGASYKGRRVGTLADATELSFHPVKPITTAEGGAVTTDDPALASAAARFRTHGITRDPAEMERDEGPWYMEQHDLGYNYRLTDVQCALGVAQMRKLDRFIERRRAIAARYATAFAGVASLQLPVERPDARSGWHLYVVRVREASRRRAYVERLRALGLSVMVHYLPVYRHPYYRRLGYRDGQCPVAEDFYARAVSLPIFPKMTDADVARAIELVTQAAREVL